MPEQSHRLSPFPIDEEILSRIRPMTGSDAGAVARLHHAYIVTSLWARLGEGFLAKLYSYLAAHPDFRGYVYEDVGRVRGFIAGSTDTRKMMREVLRGHAIRLAASTAAGAIRHPGVLTRLGETFSYFRKSTTDDVSGDTAESLFCCFEPELRGKRISGLINKVLFDELAASGHEYVKITTDAGNEGSFRQLTSWGFERIGSFVFYGKEMLIWRLDLARCERVTGGRKP